MPDADEPSGPRGVDDVGVEPADELAEELAGDLGTDPAAATTTGTASSDSVMRSSLVMGVGTVVSRFGGVLRGIVLAGALGAGTLADQFNLGNTLPNVVYILVIGGALNAVFIPQLVRHMKDDPDSGDGFANKLITLVGGGLLLVSVLAVVLAPFIVGIYASPKYTQSDLDQATWFARLCLPQIFFYGAYTMLAQVLNARGRFGAPMFAPVVNNVVAVVTFGLFWFLAGPGRDITGGPLPTWQVLLLGIGTTIGVAAQAFVLVPLMRRAGYRWRPDFRFRGAGLSLAGSLAFWTIALVAVNQVAYVFIVRMATTANTLSQAAGATAGGLTSYTNAHLIFILPHSVITVSVVAALLPRMSRAAHDRDDAALRADIGGGMRSVSALIVPSAVAMTVLGAQAGVVLFGYGGTDAAAAALTGRVAAVLALGLLPFTLYYLVLRGWYALELTRTAFWVTVVLNVLYLAFAYPLFSWLSSGSDPSLGLLGLAAGYVLSYWVTLALGWVVLARRVGGLQTSRTLTTVLRMLAAGAVMALVMVVLQRLIGSHIELHGFKGAEQLAALLDIVVVGLVGVVVYLGLARALRIAEVESMVAVVRRRLPIGR
jgi:putative peptidoglycan lipid II flippase